MSSTGSGARERRVLVVASVEGAEPEIGRWLWGLEDARRRTKRQLAGVYPAALDWTDGQEGNSIGTVLAHLAAIELDWLFRDVLEQGIPADVLALLPPA